MTSSPSLSSQIGSTGFRQRDQRLPASPPLLNPNHSIIDVVRARYRHAVKKLFSATPFVLNSPCDTLHRPEVDDAHGSDQHSRQCGDDSHPNRTSSSKKNLAKRDWTNLVDQSDSSDSASSSPPSKRRRCGNADQVVPNCAENGSQGYSCGRDGCVCANSLWTSRGVGPDIMLRTAEELSDCMVLLYGRAVDAESNQVNYSSLHNSPNFHQYLISARKLRYFDPLLLDHIERKAFFLNVYNSLMIHAITVMSKPRNRFDRNSLYNTAAYNIGGRTYTLNMIEHGVLRSNRCGSGPLAQPQFEESDARRQCALPEVDPRIHFALNCGARSCPPVRFYDASNLDKALDAATRSYLLDLDVDIENRTITVPKLLQWYKADFCEDGNMEKVLKWTLPYLEDHVGQLVEQLSREKAEKSLPFKIVFASYDWTINDSSELN